VEDLSPRLFNFPSGGFGAVWSNIRKKNPNVKEVTNTANRHRVETMVCVKKTIVVFQIINNIFFT
jgi:hypothetical protein